MDYNQYKIIEDYMLSFMNDTAHDCHHIYRVLFYALEISIDYNVDKEVLITSALLHDIGREAQYKDSSIDHAVEGAEMAFRFLASIGWQEDKANFVKECISTHRYRNDKLPSSIEAKILFDADKLDVTGAVGIARTIAYKALVSQPLYSVSDDGQVLPGNNHEELSFFMEYNYKLKNVYDKFYTKKAKVIAESRKNTSIDFYNKIYNEVYVTHKNGLEVLNEILKR